MSLKYQINGPKIVGKINLEGIPKSTRPIKDESIILVDEELYSGWSFRLNDKSKKKKHAKGNNKADEG